MMNDSFSPTNPDVDKYNISPDFARFKEKMYLISLDIKDKYFERCIPKIRELISNYPNRADVYVELGKVYYSSWMNQEAEQCYIKALKIDKEYFPTYREYSLILIKERRYDEALNILDESEKLRNREDSDIYFYKGLLFQQKGEINKAIENYQLSIQYSINENQINSSIKFLNACKELRGWE